MTWIEPMKEKTIDFETVEAKLAVLLEVGSRFDVYVFHVHSHARLVCGCQNCQFTLTLEKAILNFDLNLLTFSSFQPRRA